jgi:hypothetical protein
MKSKAISADTDSLTRGGLTRNRQKGLRTTILDCGESKPKKRNEATLTGTKTSANPIDLDFRHFPVPSMSMNRAFDVNASTRP